MKNDSDKPSKSRLTYEEVQQFISRQLDDIEKEEKTAQILPPPAPPRQSLLRRILRWFGCRRR